MQEIGWSRVGACSSQVRLERQQEGLQDVPEWGERCPSLGEPELCRQTGTSCSPSPLYQGSPVPAVTRDLHTPGQPQTFEATLTLQGCVPVVRSLSPRNSSQDVLNRILAPEQETGKAGEVMP